MMKNFRERWQAVAAIETEEQISASIALRWQQTNAVLRLAVGWGIAVDEPDDLDQAVYDRWAQLKGGQM
jgi:hypothetical protein